MKLERALVVEDDQLGREFIVEALHALGIDALAARDGREAIALLEREEVDFILTDLRMPQLDGLGVLRAVREVAPGTPIALMTAHGTVDVAVEALREGADDILIKPFSPDQLALLLERLAARQELKQENRRLRREIEDDCAARELLGDSAVMRAVHEQIRRVAQSKATVFIRGESGTGKELAARAIHALSPRHDGPFVRVNCAALSETLLESELFGHERGAFTGALQRREGRFELAHKGTLLLDEVSEVSPRIQAKLLRVLEEEEFERVGGNRTLSVDVRVIATSNRDLEKAIADGSFREDLFYRLHVVPLRLPPLRERLEDVPLLAESFLRRFARENGKEVRRIAPAALARLQGWRWPGNVRELSNVLQRAVVLAGGESIEVADLPLPAPAEEAPRNEALAGAVGMRAEDVERELILRTLRATNGNRTRTADLLDLTARTINNKIRLYREQGFTVPDPTRGVARPRPAAPAELEAAGGVA
ncbi:MAG: sigma-54-dependent Fis family transcriptional regulator [Planctomycetes bacterium]|nr:sigma-54-dependent Fis family transcriptional regulator [Planctomycetota bacterium]